MKRAWTWFNKASFWVGAGCMLLHALLWVWTSIQAGHLLTYREFDHFVDEHVLHDSRQCFKTKGER
jgi:hypothetical protein